MKLGLKKKTEKIMNDRLAAGADLKNKYRESVKPYDNPVMLQRFNEQGYKDAVNEELKKVSDNYKSSKVLSRQKIEAAIADAKNAIEKEMNAQVTHNADYNIRINNAYLALNSIQGQLDDDTLYLLLGDIVEDNNQMRVIRKMAENKLGMMIGTDGKSKYPKSFGHLTEYEAAIDKINSIEKAAKTLFLEDDEKGVIIVGGEIHDHVSFGRTVGGVRFTTLKPIETHLPSEVKFLETVDALDLSVATEDELVELATENDGGEE